MKFVSDADKQYTNMLFDCLANGLDFRLGSSIEFGKWSVALPPVNIDPLDYANWFVDKLGADNEDGLTITALNIDVNVYRDLEEQR